MVELDRTAEFLIPDLPHDAEPVSYGNFLIALGWGMNETRQFEDFLQMSLNLPFIPLNKCNQSWSGIVEKYQICAGLVHSEICEGH